MINKIKQLIKIRKKPYLNLAIYNKSYKQGIKVCNIPYKKLLLVLGVAVLIIAIITPFTNWFLIPLGIWIFKQA